MEGCGAPRGVLVTRPADAAADTARRLIALGWRPVIAPMLDIVPRVAALPPPASVQAVLVTSANALAFLPGAFHPVRLLAVGDATAARARRAGFADVESAGADATALAGLVARRCDPASGPLLLAGAAGQGADLAARLSAGGFTVLHHTVYAALPAERLGEGALAELSAWRIAAALFFSPATARTFVGVFLTACPPEIVLNVDALAISHEAAAPLAPLPWRHIRVASRPNQDELLALLS